LVVLWDSPQPLTAAQITARLPAGPGIHHALGQLRAAGLIKATRTGDRARRFRPVLDRDDYLAGMVGAILDMACDPAAVLRAALAPEHRWMTAPAQADPAAVADDYKSVAAWLRKQRLAHYWSVAEMGRQLGQAAEAHSDGTVVSAKMLAAYVRRWERGTAGVAERYRMLYCVAFGLPPDQFGPADTTGDPTPVTPLPPMTAAAPPSPSAGSVPDPDYHTAGEAAALMRVSKMTVTRLIHTGELEATRVGRSFRIPAAALISYLAAATTHNQVDG
jgi:excisionase family DNA binding protein